MVDTNDPSTNKFYTEKYIPKMLITHACGLPRTLEAIFKSTREIKEHCEHYDNAIIALEKYLEKRNLLYDRFSLEDIGYGILGEILEVSKKTPSGKYTYEELIQNGVFIKTNSKQNLNTLY